MMLNRAQIKADSKQIVRTARVSPLLVTAIVILINFALDRVVDMVENGSLFYSYTQAAEYYRALMSGNIDAILSMENVQESVGGLLSGYSSVMVGLLSTVLLGGYYLYCIGVRRGEEMPAATLLDGLGHAGRLILCDIIMTIKIALWSMLFVIPGIVAAYRYRFAMYNVLTDDSLSANQAIKLSCEQTRGMKMDLFSLDLSFIGWDILSYFTLGLADLWIMPYRTQCELAYFEEGQRRVGRPPYQDDRNDYPNQNSFL